MIVCGALITYFVFIRDKNSWTDTEIEKSPQIQLAIINDQPQSPKKISITFFEKLLNSLNTKYPSRTKQEIANALVSGHKIIVKNEVNESLLEFTAAFNSYSEKINSKFNLTLEETIATFVKIVYEI